MSVVTASIEIDAPPERVWEIVMDAKRLGEWVTIHRGVTNVSPGPPAKGFEMEQKLHLRGFDFKVHWELAECDIPKHAHWKGRGPARSKAETEYRLRPQGEGTRFDYRNEFKPPLGPLGAVASRALVGGIPRREAEATLSKLKALAEK